MRHWISIALVAAGVYALFVFVQLVIAIVRCRVFRPAVLDQAAYDDNCIAALRVKHAGPGGTLPTGDYQRPSEAETWVARRSLPMPVTRWWGRTRPCRRGVQIASDGMTAAIEIYTPLWAWPLELLHRAIFGYPRLTFVAGPGPIGGTVESTR